MSMLMQKSDLIVTKLNMKHYTCTNIFTGTKEKLKVVHNGLPAYKEFTIPIVEINAYL